MTDRTLAATVSKGARVWTHAKDPPFVSAVVLMVDDVGDITVRTEEPTPRVLILDALHAPPMAVNDETNVEDLTALCHLHDASIVECLRVRSYADNPYTWMGGVLVAVNPLKDLSARLNKHIGTPEITNAPHPSAIAEIALSQMKFSLFRARSNAASCASQSVVVSGESGSGKTESSKMILTHLVSRDSSHSTLDAQLLQTSPVLESFGNALTARNPNSSRFGKMLVLHYNNDAALTSASCATYLLERSRVSSHSPKERSFHVFYQLLRGEDAGKYGLVESDPNVYAATACEAAGDSDAAAYGELKTALGLFLSEAHVDAVFKLLAGILHLSNVAFVDGESEAECVDAQAATAAATAFGTSPDALTMALSTRSIITPDGVISARRSARGCEFARDAVCKGTYANIFDFLVDQINLTLAGDVATAASIGVLDIFGFETFAVNGFEQLLINYANEALQATFNRQIFVAEASLYEKEGLFGADEYFYKPVNNSVCVELLQGLNSSSSVYHKLGLLLTMDAESKKPEPSDLKMNQQLHQAFDGHPCFVRPHPKDIRTTFQIKHYAGMVRYTVGDFLSKNNDDLPSDVAAYLGGCDSELLRVLFAGGSSSSRISTRKPPAASSVRKFNTQMVRLVGDLETTRVSFVRCIKPNHAMLRDNDWFNAKYVHHQLKALNVPQTAEVLRNGFPTRVPYSALMEKYSQLISTSSNNIVPRDFVRALFKTFDVSPEIFKLGMTRVFFKSGQLAVLQRILDGDTDDTLPVRFATHVAVGRWRRCVAKAVAFCVFQDLLQERAEINNAVIRIQAGVRGFIAASRFNKQMRAAREAQRAWRGVLGRRIAAGLRAERAAAAAAQLEAAERARAVEEAAAAEASRAAAAAAETARALEAVAERSAHADAETERKRRQSIGHKSVLRSSRRYAVDSGGASSIRRNTVSFLPADAAADEGASVQFRFSKGKLQNRNSFSARSARFLSVDPTQIEDSAAEEKSALELVASSQRREFSIPVMGNLEVFDERKKSFFRGGKWAERFVVLKKHARLVEIYADGTRTRMTSTRRCTANTRVVVCENGFQKRQFVVEIRDRNEKSLYVGCTTAAERDRWYRDLNEAVVGFTASVGTTSHDEIKGFASSTERAMYAASVRVEKIAALKLLKKRGIISAEELDAACAEISDEKDGRVAKLADGTLSRVDSGSSEDAESDFEDAVTCGECGRVNDAATTQVCAICDSELEITSKKSSTASRIMQEKIAAAAASGLEPLDKPICSDLPYKSGFFKCELLPPYGVMDPTDFSESTVFPVSCRFRSTETSREVGWVVERSMAHWRSLSKGMANMQLKGVVGIPLADSLSDAIARRTRRKKFDAARVEMLRKFLTSVLKHATAVPAETREEAPPRKSILGKKPTAWRKDNFEVVVDPDTGETYYYNRALGVSTWENPLGEDDDSDSDDSSRPPSPPPKKNLPPGWEMIYDEHTNEVYYWHAASQSSQWHLPFEEEEEEEEAPRKNLNVLALPKLERFLELKHNSARAAGTGRRGGVLRGLHGW